MKRKKFIEEDVQYYHVRNNNQLVGTVALYEVPGKTGRGHKRTYCRGIAICSIYDNFNREEGRRDALARLKKAYFTQENSEPVRVAAGTGKPGRGLTYIRFQAAYPGFKTKVWYKSAYTTLLSPFEKKIMEKRRESWLNGSVHTRKGAILLTGEQKLISVEGK